MRKILIIVIIILFIVLAYNVVANGFQIGDMEILSVGKIEEKNSSLDGKIEEINTSINTTYPQKMKELKTASGKMEDAKLEYLQYTNMSTDEEILAAMQEKKYKIEFLWTELGTHARNEGVVLKFEIVSSSTGANNTNDIRFTVNGSYIAITNFVYALENDSNLNFKIENFKLLPYQDEILEGTFTVRNITVTGNTSSKTITQNSTNTNTTTVDTTNDANATTTTTTNTGTVTI